jgi:hypothetical protein
MREFGVERVYNGMAGNIDSIMWLKNNIFSTAVRCPSLISNVANTFYGKLFCMDETDNVHNNERLFCLFAALFWSASELYKLSL